MIPFSRFTLWINFIHLASGVAYSMQVSSSIETCISIHPSSLTNSWRKANVVSKSLFLFIIMTAWNPLYKLFSTWDKWNTKTNVYTNFIECNAEVLMKSSTWYSKLPVLTEVCSPLILFSFLALKLWHHQCSSASSHHCILYCFDCKNCTDCLKIACKIESDITCYSWQFQFFLNLHTNNRKVRNTVENHTD